MMWYVGDGSGWLWFLMTIVIVVIWAAIIPAVVLGIRYLTSRPSSRDRAVNGSAIAQQVLAEDSLPAKSTRTSIDTERQRCAKTTRS